MNSSTGAGGLLDSMNDRELREAVNDFEEVIKASERFSTKGSRLSAILCAFFAMRCAFRIRLCVEACGLNAIIKSTEEGSGDHQFEELGELPKPAVVHDAGEMLLAAVNLQDANAAESALKEMGIIGLCPNVSEHLIRLERAVRSVPERTQLILLTELALFAAAAREFDRAAKYVKESRAFDPAAYELYCLCIVEGLIAMNAGQDRQAIQCLQRSIAACQRDEYASLACGVRSPNLALVESLLNGGYRVEVLEHLLECKNVWQSFRTQIDVWISLIESGERPNFHNSPTLRSMNEPACRLIMQYARARALEEENSLGVAAPQTSVPMSATEVLARRDRLQEAYRRAKERPTGS